MTLQIDAVLRKWLQYNHPYLLKLEKQNESGGIVIEQKDSLYDFLYTNFVYTAQEFDREYDFWRTVWDSGDCGRVGALEDRGR